MPERFMDGALKVRRGCMEGSWRVHGKFIEGTWKVHGGHMEGSYRYMNSIHTRSTKVVVIDSYVDPDQFVVFIRGSASLHEGRV